MDDVADSPSEPREGLGTQQMQASIPVSEQMLPDSLQQGIQELSIQEEPSALLLRDHVSPVADPAALLLSNHFPASSNGSQRSSFHFEDDQIGPLLGEHGMDVPSGVQTRRVGRQVSSRQQKQKEIQLARMLEGIGKEVSLLRNNRTENAAERLAHWCDEKSMETFDPPCEFSGLPDGLRAALGWVVKQLKEHREGIGLIARSVKPWEEIVLAGNSEKKEELAAAAAAVTTEGGEAAACAGPVTTEAAPHTEKAAFASEKVVFASEKEREQASADPLDGTLAPEHASVPESPLALGAVALSWMVRTEGALRERDKQLERLEEGTQILRNRFDKYSVELSRYLKKPQRIAVPSHGKGMDLFCNAVERSTAKSRAERSGSIAGAISEDGSQTPSAQNVDEAATGIAPPDQGDQMDSVAATPSASRGGSRGGSRAGSPGAEGRGYSRQASIQSQRNRTSRSGSIVGSKMLGKSVETVVVDSTPLLAVTRGEFSEMQRSVEIVEESMEAMQGEVARLVGLQQKRIDDLEVNAAAHFNDLRGVARLATEAAEQGLEATKRASALAQAHLDAAAARSDLLYTGQEEEEEEEEDDEMDLYRSEDAFEMPEMDNRFAKGTSQLTQKNLQRGLQSSTGSETPKGRKSDQQSSYGRTHVSYGSESDVASNCGSSVSRMAPSRAGSKQQSGRGSKTYKGGADPQQSIQLMAVNQSIRMLETRVKTLDGLVHGMVPEMAAFRQGLATVRIQAKAAAAAGGDRRGPTSPAGGQTGFGVMISLASSNEKSPSYGVDASKGQTLRSKMEAQKRMPKSSHSPLEGVGGGVAVHSGDPFALQSPGAASMAVRMAGDASPNSEPLSPGLALAMGTGPPAPQPARAAVDKRKQRPVSGFRGLKSLSSPKEGTIPSEGMEGVSADNPQGLVDKLKAVFEPEGEPGARIAPTRASVSGHRQSV